jgi:2-polyprenyl-3-methyl-5-hydroxy-6-metoxy-1,4-benzoquinol methylase
MKDVSSPNASPETRESDIAERLRNALGSPDARRSLVETLLSNPDNILSDVLEKLDLEDLKQLLGYPGRLLPFLRWYVPPPPPFRQVRLGDAALHRLVTHYTFDSVLDVGAGAGLHAQVFRDCGKMVTKLDFGTSVYAQVAEVDGIRSIVADANKVELNEIFDCVWACHVLEHQPNVNMFIERLKQWTREEGLIAITVPAAKFNLAGGHLTLWTPALLIYNLVFAGIDCAEAEVLHYGYNISVIVKNRPIKLPELHYDMGDITRLAEFMPPGFREGVDGFRVAKGVGTNALRVRRRNKKTATKAQMLAAAIANKRQ